MGAEGREFVAAFQGVGCLDCYRGRTYTPAAEPVTALAVRARRRGQLWLPRKQKRPSRAERQPKSRNARSAKRNGG